MPLSAVPASLIRRSSASGHRTSSDPMQSVRPPNAPTKNLVVALTYSCALGSQRSMRFCAVFTPRFIRMPIVPASMHRGVRFRNAVGGLVLVNGAAQSVLAQADEHLHRNHQHHGIRRGGADAVENVGQRLVEQDFGDGLVGAQFEQLRLVEPALVGQQRRRSRCSPGSPAGWDRRPAPRSNVSPTPTMIRNSGNSADAGMERKACSGPSTI